MLDSFPEKTSPCHLLSESGEFRTQINFDEYLVLLRKSTISAFLSDQIQRGCDGAVTYKEATCRRSGIAAHV